MARIVVETPVYGPYRLTVPSREALISWENQYRPATEDECKYLPRDGVARFMVELHRPVNGMIECLIGHGSEQHRGLRLSEEPEYPGEWPPDAIAWHERGCWTPCPKCGSALVWYEAGYVPGYRVCVARQHHAQLSSDGRSAKHMARKGIAL